MYITIVIPGVISDPKHIWVEYLRVLFSVFYSFLVNINDIVEETESNINSFADDTCLSMVVGNPSAAGTILQNDIKK